MNLAQAFKRIADILWLVGGIGAAAELGLDGIGPEDATPNRRGPNTRGPGAPGQGAPGSSGCRPGENQGRCGAPGNGQSLRVGHA